MSGYDEVELEEEFARTSLKRRTFGRILRYLRPFWRPVALGASIEATWVVCMLIEPRLVRLAMDGPLPQGDVGGVAWFGALFLANLAFRVAITVWELRMTTAVGIQVLHAIRKDLFDHIQRLSMRYFDRTKQGRIIARLDRDVDTLEHLVLWGPILVTSFLFALGLGFAQLVYTHAQLAWWLLPAIPVLFGLTRLFERFAVPAYRKVRERHAAISSHVAETVTGVRVVQAFSAEGRTIDALRGLQGAYREAVLRAARIGAGYRPSLMAIFHVLQLATLAVGGAAVARGDLTVGALVEFVWLLGFVFGPVEGLGSLYNECLVAGAAAERIFLLLDTAPEVRDRPDARDPGRLTGAIAFEHVGFSYDPAGTHGRQLADISFRVAPGETVALVGHTGAGKTSIASLLARFYEAQEGVVRIDGHDVRDLRLEALHRQMGIVPQENFLFSGSILDNLRFVKPDVTPAEGQAAFAELGCQDVLAGLKGGLDAPVGERGANLSEGERQVVCFVRAWLARPALLVLDEATSAVDTRTEATILKALRTLAKRQTTVIIAHRLSTIRAADRVFVLDHGRLVEEGTHDSLLARGGTYAALYREYAA